MATQRMLARVQSPNLLWQRLVTSRLGSTASAGSQAVSAPRSSDNLTLEDFLPGAKEQPIIKASAQPLKAPVVRKPKWLKMYNPNLTPEGAERYKMVRSKIKQTGLSTVCQEARCPNVGECWSGGTATIMIMGDTCTRGCRFCSVATSRTPPALDAEEPEKVMDAVRKWQLDYIVLTMVDRDDLPDQGAGHVAATVRRLKSSGDLRVETLCGDFQGKIDLVKQVLDSGMDVFAHNIETVERLQRLVRDRRASYEQTLAVLKAAKEYRPDVVTKSSIMVGLGESSEEVHQTMVDLRDIGVEIVTLGQYLQPTKRHMKVSRFVTPEEFDKFRLAGEALGLHVASGPLVRSSYRAGDFFKERLARRAEDVPTTSVGPCEVHISGMEASSTQPSAQAA